MRRILLLASALVALAVLGTVAPGGAGAATYPQCPPVYKDTGCQFLVTVSSSGETISEDSTQGPYESSDDALVGIVNNSSSPVSSIHLSAEDELFGFEGDGICTPGGAPIAPGCKVAAENSGHEKTSKAGMECVYEGEERKGKAVTEDVLESCAFPVPAGEPAGLTFPEFVEPVGFEHGDAVSGYEGPRSYYTGIGALGSNATGSGTVNFSPALAPGESTYFSLESPPAGGFGSSSTLSTTLSGGGQSGASITVIQGTSVTDTAALSGANASIATGTVSYNVYSDAACTKLAAAAGSASISGANAGASTAVNLAPGTYYWQASYGGDINNKAISSTCGSEVLTVQAPTSTTTAQTGGGVTSPSIPVLLGTAVTDKATVNGSLASQAVGTVTYTLYSDSKCTKPLASSLASVVGGVAGSSAPVKPAKVGTYYWTAIYSGGGLDAASASACGSEQLVVSKHAVLFEKSAGKKCYSKRAFAIHPKFPKGVKITGYKEYVNGALAKQGHLTNHATSVNLVGAPKGTYKVELVTFTASGSSFEDTRTFHTCVPKKHKKHH
jgi:hypothetical protein